MSSLTESRPPGVDAVAAPLSASPAEATLTDTRRSDALCVYYDGGCPLCRAEIASYQRTAGGETLQWVDATACGPAALGPGLDVPTALARLHVRQPDGTLLQGAAAFVAIWSQLPRWRWLARVAQLPGVLPLLELAYTLFLKVRPLWRAPSPSSSAISAKTGTTAWPAALRRELRTDHAGETGAVMIYRGVLAVSRDPDVRAFARHHLDTEQQHLQWIEAVVPRPGRSRLLPIWRLSGWLTGALPALFGPRAVFATIQTVETFVDRHYEAQLRQIDALARDDLAELRALLARCQSDELAHRDDAHARWDQQPGALLRLWLWLVRHGSEQAVGVCRHI